MENSNISNDFINKKNLSEVPNNEGENGCYLNRTNTKRKRKRRVWVGNYNIKMEVDNPGK